MINLSTFKSNEPNRTGYFIKRCIPATINDRLNVTYFFYDTRNDDFVGFISISAHRLALKKEADFLGEKEISKDPQAEKDYIPAVKIDQLAVSEPYQGMKIATDMLSAIILDIIDEISLQIGIRLIYAEIYDKPSNIGLFKSFEFEILKYDWFSSRDPSKPSKTRYFPEVPFEIRPVFFDIK